MAHTDDDLDTTVEEIAAAAELPAIKYGPSYIHIKQWTDTDLGQYILQSFDERVRPIVSRTHLSATHVAFGTLMRQILKNYHLGSGTKTFVDLTIQYLVDAYSHLMEPYD